MTTNAVKILEQTDDTVTVGGYGVVFGGHDLEGDTFTPDTEYKLGMVPEKPVFYDHTLTEVKHDLGTVTAVKSDGTGLWIEAQLARSRDYVDEVMKLVERGVLGWSSGSIAHLVRRDGGVIKSWPVVEFSLTPTPAEPRTIGVQRLKQLADIDPRLQAAIAEASGEDASKAATAAATDAPNNQSSTITEPIMSDETKAAAAPDPVLAAINELGMSVKGMAQRIEQLENTPAPAPEVAVPSSSIKGAPAILKHGLGDSETKAFATWVRTGDGGALGAAMKASNNTDMNVGTNADGGFAVPTGHYNGIIARRDESMLANTLGVRNIPGMGTTVNVPVDNEADGEFVSTAEAAQFDRDAPALNQVAMTLVKYTKRIQVSYELMQDEESRLMDFLADFVGRGMAKTHNDLLITEVETNGTNLLTTASTTAIAAGEIEDTVYNNDLGPYLDDSGSAAWVMRPSTYGKIVQLTGNDRLYAEQAQGSNTSVRMPLLEGFPVRWSQKVEAYGTLSNKFAHFGNWNFVGRREAPGFTVLRDPYSRAEYGQIVLHYYFRTVYKVLQAEAIGYVDHAAA